MTKYMYYCRAYTTRSRKSLSSWCTYKTMEKYLLFRLAIFLIINSLLLFFSEKASAQASLNYSIGFTTPLSQNNIDIPTNTDPLSISEDKKCINLNTGISKFLKSETGLFLLTCTTQASFLPLSFILFPNPITANYVIVKLTSSPASSSGNFVVKIIGVDGLVSTNRSASLAELKAGLRITLPNLGPGLYIINVLCY